MNIFTNKKGETFENYMNTVLFDSVVSVDETEFFIADVMKFKDRIEMHSFNRVEIEMRTDDSRVFFKITMKFIKKIR